MILVCVHTRNTQKESDRPAQTNTHAHTQDEGGGKSRQCFRASCDWAPYFQKCAAVRSDIRKCLLLDALAHQSLEAIPSLVYVKPGKGFTAPNYLETGGRPFRESDERPYSHHQGEGRCVNAVCRTDSPPPAGDSSLPLAPGEAWCSTVNWNGRVMQTASRGITCNAPEADGTRAAESPCDDLGEVMACYLP